MLTVGLVKELSYLSILHDYPISCQINIGKDSLLVEIDKKLFKAFYKNNHIWTEEVDISDDGLSHFGLESCANIAQIIDEMNFDNESWRKLVYHQS